jgi:hypothetical protein
VSDWGSSADLDFRDRNNVTKSNQLDTNADVTTQTHDYLTGAYDERMRIIELLENQIYCRRYEGLFWKDTIDKVSIPELVALIKGENK